MSWGVDNNTNRLLYKYLIQLEQMRASRAAACIKHNLDNVNTALVNVTVTVSQVLLRLNRREAQ